MKCSKCQKLIKDGINFCPYCQTKVNEKTTFTPSKPITHSNQRSTTF
jgi:uncharacterized Zn finger protein (UPF0148 family)